MYLTECWLWGIGLGMLIFAGYRNGQHVTDRVMRSSLTFKGTCGNGARKTLVSSKYIFLNCKVFEESILPPVNLKFNWIKWVPLKVNAFCWRATLDRISSKANLYLRGIHVDTTCEGCRLFEENTDHVLINCFLASNVWSKVVSWCKGPTERFGYVKEALEVWMEWVNDKMSSQIYLGIFLTALWCI
ncbi:hypothetical protein SSX86_030522 [Deinandra increscens subsp. villosa]|uniref:Reverse transcriptase zinc-binding domain-containing protein n=1 Tax=Deinandra increscens subsp. villosa TaxID=3103831 RepID=A0AAP0C846_9ASTR